MTIETLELLQGDLPRPQMRKVLEWARENRVLLRETWAGLRRG